tara:strand:+ start:3389 stop:4447 length:1059 start_codon:yes stop_codon:yes gene_type:complete
MIEIPAFLDLHTHTRYPDKSFFPAKDIEKSAMNGGYSDILAMPNSEISIDDIEALKIAKEIDSSLNINVHRVGALSKGLRGKELVDFKSFIKNGVTIFSDDGKSLIEDKLAEQAFKIVSELDGAIFQHCEKSCFSSPGDIAPPSNLRELTLIPDSEEFEILKRDLDLVEKYNTRYHAQHLSSKKSVELIEKAKNKNLPVTAEVTPHHLLINNENLDTTNGKYKMYPPIRTEKDRQALVNGLKAGVIDTIATDHAPHPEDTKNVRFKEAARGVVGLESAFPVLYSSDIFTLDELKIFLIDKPREILQNLGYEIEKPFNNKWRIGNELFHTKSEYKNSAFENFEVNIKKVDLYV